MSIHFDNGSNKFIGRQTSRNQTQSHSDEVTSEKKMSFEEFKKAHPEIPSFAIHDAYNGYANSKNNTQAQTSQTVQSKSTNHTQETKNSESTVSSNNTDNLNLSAQTFNKTPIINAINKNNVVVFGNQTKGEQKSTEKKDVTTNNTGNSYTTGTQNAYEKNVYAPGLYTPKSFGDRDSVTIEIGGKNYTFGAGNNGKVKIPDETIVSGAKPGDVDAMVKKTVINGEECTTILKFDNGMSVANITVNSKGEIVKGRFIDADGNTIKIDKNGNQQGTVNTPAQQQQSATQTGQSDSENYADSLSDGSNWTQVEVHEAVSKPENNERPEGVHPGALEIDNGIYELYVADNNKNGDYVVKYKVNDNNQVETKYYYKDTNGEERELHTMPDILKDILPADKKNPDLTADFPKFFNFAKFDPGKPNIVIPQNTKESVNTTDEGAISLKDQVDALVEPKLRDAVLNNILTEETSKDNKSQNTEKDSTKPDYMNFGSTPFDSPLLNNGEDITVSLRPNGDNNPPTPGNTETRLRDSFNDQLNHSLSDPGALKKQGKTVAINETTTIKDSDGNVLSNSIEHFEYNASGEKLKTSESIMDKTGNVTAYVEYIRDENGNVIRTDTYETDTNGNVIETSRDAEGNENTKILDKNGNKISPNHSTKSYNRTINNPRSSIDAANVRDNFDSTWVKGFNSYLKGDMSYREAFGYGGGGMQVEMEYNDDGLAHGLRRDDKQK